MATNLSPSPAISTPTLPSGASWVSLPLVTVENGKTNTFTTFRVAATNDHVIPTVVSLWVIPTTTYDARGSLSTSYLPTPSSVGDEVVGEGGIAIPLPLSGPISSSSSATGITKSSIVSSVSAFSSLPGASSSSEAHGNAATQLPNSSPTLQTMKSSNRPTISAGIVAGTAVGCFIIGVAVATLGAWALLNRSRKKAQMRRHRSLKGDAEQIGLPPIKDPPNLSGEHKYTVIPATRIPAPNEIPVNEESKPLPAPPLGKHMSGHISEAGEEVDQGRADLLSPTFSIRRKRISDPAVAAALAGLTGTEHAEETEARMKEVRTQIKTLFEQIGLHIDNFYNDSPNNTNLTSEEQMNLVMLDSPWLYDAIAGVLPAAVDVKPLLKHCVASLIIERSAYDRVGNAAESSLLPMALTRLHKQLGESKYANNEQLQQWRVATLGLFDAGSREASEEVQLQADRLAQSISKALQPWADKQYSLEARSSHLTTILCEAVELGLTIFAIVESVEWEWEQFEGDEDRLFMFPGLIVRRPTAEEGDIVGDRIRKSGIELVAPTIASIEFRK